MSLYVLLEIIIMMERWHINMKKASIFIHIQLDVCLKLIHCLVVIVVAVFVLLYIGQFNVIEIKY